MKRCSGIYTALVTPFTEKGSLDLDGLRLHVRRQVAAQVDGITVLGTTGEAFSLTPQERRELITLVRQESPLPLMVGCGSYSTAEALDHVLRAAELGANSALVLTPFYNRPTPEGVFRHFEAICHRSPIPIVLYNNPSRTGVHLETEMVQGLAQLPQVVGIKESSGNLTHFSDIVATMKISHPTFSFIAGDDSLFFPAMAVGADGVISGSANLIPKTLVTLLNLCKNKEWQEGQNLHLKLVPLFKALTIEGNPVALKAALRLGNLPGGHPRLPLTPLNSHFLPILKSAVTPLLEYESH